ncbi:hypothetical protein QYE76_059883 [Lolium multiflorum]|uniref:Uncharacterized protein n=1 Tax=Lolium multiflorum TaxID=4521 RepID=A0AAD8W3R3_LOLMU|nr:hypothetical protein QYE76_059883 [Lolium multiflorum]
MVKKKGLTAAASSTSGGAAAKSSSNLPKGSAPTAPPPALAPPAPPSSVAKPGDWIASTVTKRDEKRSRSLGLISSDEGNVIFPAVEETRASPVKRSTGGFDEDDLLDMDEGFAEPPSKKARSDAVPPAVAASEASAPKATPAAQASTASSLSKGKDVPAATTTPPSDLRGVISSLEAFASQFTSLEADKVRLQEEVKSSSSKLDGAIKKAATTRQEVDSLKEELGKLKERLKEEEARAAEKDELLRQSSLALLEAANIPAAALDKVPNSSPANGVSMALASHQLTRELLEKGKGALARMHLMIFPKIKQDKTLGHLIDAFAVFPVPSFVDDSSGALPEGDRIQRMKDRITQMEKDMRSTYALAAIVNKKSEIAAKVERYPLTELHKATESLNFIALNRAEENKRIHERVHALTQLSSAEEIFWREHSKASAVALFQDRVQQVHHFFDKCYKAMRVVWKTMFPLNAIPPTLLTLMSEFGNAKKIRDLVRAQVFAGARFALALVLARYPSANLLAIANAVGDLDTLYPKVLLPANIIVDKFEEYSKGKSSTRTNVDPNNVPLASLVAQEENVDVNFIKNNNFNNNVYRNNSSNNYRPYPYNNGNGYGNSYGNSYNNNRSVPPGLEAMLKEFISTQTAFNKSVEEKLDKIDILASRVDRLASDVDLLKLKVMPNKDIDNKITTTANAIQVRINENIRLMAELHARWEREENEKLAKENNVAKVWTITTTSNVNATHVAAPPTNNGERIGVGNVSTSNVKPAKLPEIAKTAETACDKTAEIFSNIGDDDPIAVDHNGLDFDDCHIFEVIKFLQKLAKSPNASAINLAFTKHITNALIKAREEKLKLETSIPRKLEDGWEPIINMKVNDFDCNALCDLGASISVMPKKVYDMLDLPPLKNCYLDVNLADNAKKKPLGRVDNVRIMVNNNLVPVDFVVLDIECNASCPIILGRPFLRTVGAIIDMNEVFKGQERSMIYYDQEVKALSLGMPGGSPAYFKKTQASKLGDAQGIPFFIDNIIGFLP